MKLSQSRIFVELQTLCRNWLPRGPAQDSKSRVQAADFRERLCESELHGGTAAEREREPRGRRTVGTNKKIDQRKFEQLCTTFC